jgi:hypothetical protein
MTTLYPGAIDPPTTYQDLIDRPYAAHLNQAYERILKIQQVLGVNPQAAYDDVAARMGALEIPPQPLVSVHLFIPSMPETTLAHPTLIASPTVEFAPHNMTTADLPAPYHATASTQFSGLESFHAFDGLLSGGHYWVTNTGNTTGWIKIDVGTANANKLQAYAVVVNTIPEPNRAPRNFDLSGSIDDISYDNLDTQTGQISWGTGQARMYMIAPAKQLTAYRYFKLNITLNNGDGSYCGIAELYLYSAP